MFTLSHIVKPVIKSGAVSLAVLGSVLALSTTAYADSLDNMERERANLLTILLDPSLDAEKRFEKASHSQHRLADMERMVLRDDTLINKGGLAVKTAFQNYDLTFLVHAATEKDITVMELWMDQLGLSNQATVQAQMGRR